jgi:hypothetical protein
MALCQTTADPITAATMIARRISAGTKQQEQLPATPLVWDLRIIDSCLLAAIIKRCPL